MKSFREIQEASIHTNNLTQGTSLKAIGEAKKDEGEYDFEGDMAMSQLRSIIRNSQMLHDKLKPNTNLPEWVQSKITLAEDYIVTAAQYMESEMDEEIKKGDVVYPKIGPHSGHPHRVIHSFGDGRHNISPMLLPPKKIKYRLGAASAHEKDLSTKNPHIHHEEVEVEEAYSDPYAAKKAAEMKKVHSSVMADAKKELETSKKTKFAKNFMKLKKEEVSKENKKEETPKVKYKKARSQERFDARFKEMDHNYPYRADESFQVDEVITKSTPTGDVIHDFVHSENPKFAGKSKKERIRMALGAKYAMMRGKK